MSDAKPMEELFAEADELRSVLADLNVKYVRISANGHWSFEKLGRARHGTPVLQRGLLLRVAELVPLGRHLRSGEWAIRKTEGVSGPSLLIERLPLAVADRLPQEVLATLKRQVKSAGNGVLVGEPGSGKGGLLLWLALQIPDQPVLYVSENPPSEFPGTHVMHVYPPANDSERRALERFVRLAPIVMWDRVTHAQDLQTLYGFAGATRRWFTTDATSVRSALRLLTAASHNGFDTRFSTMLYLGSSVIGRPEARNLVLRTESGWTEQWSAGSSVLSLLEAYDASDVRRLGPTEISRPDIVAEAKVQVEEEFAAEAESVASPIEHEVGIARPPTSEGPLTIEVEDEDIEPYTRGDDAITGMIPREEIRELREQGLVPEDSDEIPALVAPTPVPEQTKAYMETPTELLGHDTTNPARYLKETAEGAFSDPEEIPDPPEVNLADLRITTMEELDPLELDLLEEEVGDIDSDFSEVFEAEIDFDSMMSEISDIDSPMDETAMATNPSRLVLIDDGPSVGNDSTDAAEDSPTVAASGDLAMMAQLRSAPGEDAQDSTKEFTLNDRLMMLRKRRNED